MLNQVILVGRITTMINDSGVLRVTISVPRSFKNEDGEFMNDLITFKCYNSMVDNVESYCEEGSLVGIKGRIENNDGMMDIVAEKLTFLSRGNKEEE